MVFALLALGVTPASAAQTRLLQASFGPDGTAASTFEQPAALGVDQATGDVYVADYAAGSVEKFNSAHEPVEFAGLNPDIVAGRLTGFSFFTSEPESELAVNSASHDFYVVNNGDKSVKAFHADGEPADFTAGPGAGTNAIGGFSEPCGVAVDSNGDIYAGDFGLGVPGTVTVYAPTGEPIVTFTSPNACQVAVDSHGTVYRNRFLGPIEKFVPSEFPVTPSTSYSEAGVVDENPSWGVAVDPASNDLFVDEHTGAAEYDEGGTRLATFGALSASEGLAVNGATSQVYVSDAGGERQVEIFGPLVTLPVVTTGEATGVLPTSATLNGTVNPEGIQLSDCHFDYGTSTSYGQSAPCVPVAESIPADSSEHAVTAEVKGLAPGTTYHFRLQASNANGSEFGQDATLATPPPPSIDGATATNLTASSVDLHATVNPGGLQVTDCHFEYGTTTEYEHHDEPCEQPVGSGTSDVPVTRHIGGLEHDRTYHWRVVATNAAGTTMSPDHTFVYPTSGGGLPDNRAYEMVTPPQKNGALIGNAFTGLAPDLSEDGSRLIVTSIQCFDGAESCPAVRGHVGTSYAFTRTNGGWVTAALAPSAIQFDANSVWSVSADAGTALFSMPTPPHGEDDLYARRPDGSFIDIGPVTSPEEGAKGPVGAQGALHAATADLSHVVFLRITGESHWPFDLSERHSVYEYVRSGNAQPALVGVSGGVGNTDLISICDTHLGTDSDNTQYPGTLSADGRTVYFTAGACKAGGSGANAGIPVLADSLYARIDESRTVPISQRSPLDCKEAACLGSHAGIAMFQGASADGSKAFFTSTQQLTDNASEDSQETDTALETGCTSTTGPNGCNLYEYDFTNPPGHNLLAASAGDTSGHGPRVQGVMAISADGSHVYFVARGVLTSVANGQGETAQDGADNLYLFERDASHPGGRTTFIATLSAANFAAEGSDSAQWILGVGVANVTSDGRFLVFTSRARLTPDDTSSIGATQIFRYDALTGSLVRVSIGERGFNDNGNAGSPRAIATFAEAVKHGFSERAGPVRSDPTMSHDGAYVFFASPVGLTPQALNEVQIGVKEHEGRLDPVYAQNVYEYHEGHVYLISDGKDVGKQSGASDVQLIGSDASGANVFFTTSDQLASQDTDTQLDFYDARICTASEPCIKSPPPTLPPCSGEVCHGTPGATPMAPNVPTATFNGVGNAVPPTMTVPKKSIKKTAGCSKRKRHKHSCAKKKRSKKTTRVRFRTGTKR